MHRIRTTPIAAVFVGVAVMTLLAADTPVIADKQVNVAGRRIHYLEAGEGPPVVLVHGLGANARTWRFVLPALASNFRVLALDQIGFGQSDKPEIPYRVGTLVDNLTGFMDAVGVEKASVVGNSLGGWVAALFATRHPERLDKLVLVDAAGYGEDPSQMARDFLSQLDPAALAAAQQWLAGLTPEQQRAMEAMAAAYFARRMSRGDGYAVAGLIESIMRGEDALGPEVKGIRAPTLVLWGRNDRVVPLRVGEALAGDIPGARKLVLDGCGHRPQTECAPAFNVELRKFLASD